MRSTVTRVRRKHKHPDANLVLLRAHLFTAVDSMCRKPWVRNCSRERKGLYNGNVQQNRLCAASCVCVCVCVFFSYISLIADGPHHYHPACGHKGSSHLSPVHALQFFYRDASSALLQLVNQWLNFTYSRSHAFRYERKNTNPTLVRIEFTTSALAGVQVTY